jgi:AmiR/NasT family two-component response regulator
VSESERELVTGLRHRIAELETENEQLRTALETRIVVEQAKGVLVERLGLPADEAFKLLRQAARRSRTKIHAVADDLLASRTTPDYIEREVKQLADGDGKAWIKPS